MPDPIPSKTNRPKNNTATLICVISILPIPIQRTALSPGTMKGRIITKTTDIGSFNYVEQNNYFKIFIG